MSVIAFPKGVLVGSSRELVAGRDRWLVGREDRWLLRAWRLVALDALVVGFTAGASCDAFFIGKRGSSVDEVVSVVKEEM